MAFARIGQRTLLIDGASGDLPAVFGLEEEHPSVGITQWIRSSADVPASSLAQVGTDLLLNLRLVHNGANATADFTSESAQRLEQGLPGFTAIVDAAGLSSSTSHLASHAELSLCVIRPCYLAASRVVRSSVHADGLVVIEESGRTLRAQDIAESLGIPIACQLKWDNAIARAVDAGRLGAANFRSTKSIGELAHRLVSTGKLGVHA